jgi:hypothetical protein
MTYFKGLPDPMKKIRPAIQRRKRINAMRVARRAESGARVTKVPSRRSSQSVVVNRIGTKRRV